MADTFGVDAVALAVLIVLVTAVLLYLYRRFSVPKEKVVLLCGVSGSGKTAMFLRLVTGRFMPTFISSVPNEADLNFNRKSTVRLVDLPGAEELRSLVRDRLKRPVAAILFVLDSSNYAKECKEVSEFLYELLTVVKGRRTRLLVACSKQDLLSAKSSTIIQTAVQRELGLLNKTRVRALDSTKIGGVGAGAGQTSRLLDNADAELTWDALPVRVDFCDCSSKTLKLNENAAGEGKPTLFAVKQWLQGL